MLQKPKFKMNIFIVTLPVNGVVKWSYVADYVIFAVVAFVGIGQAAAQSKQTKQYNARHHVFQIEIFSSYLCINFLKTVVHFVVYHQRAIVKIFSLAAGSCQKPARNSGVVYCTEELANNLVPNNAICSVVCQGGATTEDASRNYATCLNGAYDLVLTECLGEFVCDYVNESYYKISVFGILYYTAVQKYGIFLHWIYMQ